MNNIRLLKLCVALVLLAAVGCGRADRVRIGSKPFTENRLIAEMYALLAEDKGIRVERKIPYGDSFDCLRAVENDDLDLYPDYNGTLLAMKGVAREDQLPTVLEPDGLEWTGKLGFENPWVLFVLPETAANGISRISDLRKLIDQERPVKLGCDSEFARRSIDGLAPLRLHYGFKESGLVHKKLETDGREQLFRALRDRDLDVVVADRTDGRAADLGLVGLIDDKNFFHRSYEPAALVRKSVLDEKPELREVIAALEGKISADDMREMVLAVDVYGAAPRSVAAEFLVEKQLLAEKPPELSSNVLKLAVPVGTPVEPTNRDQRPVWVNRSLRAVREANPNRRVELIATGDLEADVLSDKAYVGVMSAERFFDSETGRRTEKVEAIAPVGYHTAHLIVKADRTADAPIKRMGVGVENGPSVRGGKVLADVYGIGTEQINGPFESQLAELRSGSLDAVLRMAEVGDPRVRQSLTDGTLKLKTLDRWADQEEAIRFSYFRGVLIQANTYPNQPEEVLTFGSQIVIIGPAPPPGGLGDAGPLGAVWTERQPIPDKIREKMRQATGLEEEFDPVLPGRAAGGRREPDRSINPAPEVSFMTLLLFAGAVYFAWVLIRTKPQYLEPPPEATETPAPTTGESQPAS